MSDLTQTFAALLMSSMGVDMPEGNHPDMKMSHRDWVWLDRHRLELSASWRKTFERWDLVVCPVAPTTAFQHDSRPFEERTIEVNGSRVGYEKLPFWAALATPCGLPVTTVPLGLDSAGLPVGAQIIGPRLEDYTPLAFAGLLESGLGLRFTAGSTGRQRHAS
jgi:amidase